MINFRTVFVLGAGASRSYGIATAKQLGDDVIDTFLTRPDERLIAYLARLGAPRSTIQRFCEVFRDSGKYSVDAFLEGLDESDKEREAFISIGKRAMAALLMRYESHHALFDTESLNRRNDDWYRLLFNKLGARFEDLGRNNVSFLTFNYDRSLEYYLMTTIINSYAKTFSEAKAAIETLNIVHLYGHLGEITESSLNNWRDPRPELNEKHISQAADGIQILSDRNDNSTLFDRAHALLREAQVICFLGFSYQKTNVERLFKDVVVIPAVRILGSAHGMEGIAERKIADALLRKCTSNATKYVARTEELLDDRGHKVKAFLLNRFEWWDN